MTEFPAFPIPDGLDLRAAQEQLQATAEAYDRSAAASLACGSRNSALEYSLRAALARMEFPEEVQVGHLAWREQHAFGSESPIEVLIKFIGDDIVVYATRSTEGVTRLGYNDLTYSRPCPDGWPNEGVVE